MSKIVRLFSRLILVATLTGAIALPATCRGAIKYTGANLAGAEFGPTPTPGNFGTYGQNSNYFYPTQAEVNYYVGKGLNTFRLPIRWERLQHSQNGALDATELSRLDAFVGYATSNGASVIIEPHNFQRYFPDPNNFQTSTQGLVGSAVPDSAYADFWSRVADRYKNNYRVIFNLMNEPNSLPSEQLVTSSNAAIAAIRATGANNLILVPGNQWTGAWAWVLPNDSDNNPNLPGRQSWYGTVNADAMLNIVDSANNFAFDVHQYLDSDSSGGTANIVSDTIGRDRLVDFTGWLHANHRRGYLGEFAVANSQIGTGETQIGDEAINNMLGYVEDNSDVWLGWAWWAGGPKWGNYMFTLDPTNLGQAGQTDRAAMPLLQPHLAPLAPAQPGDFNNNGIFDTADYVAWRNGLGTTYTPDDYNLWAANYERSLAVDGLAAGSSISASVPECSTFALLSLGSLWLSIFLRHRRRHGRFVGDEATRFVSAIAERPPGGLPAAA